jgi:hypothetical protein
MKKQDYDRKWRNEHPDKVREYIRRAAEKRKFRYQNDLEFHNKVNKTNGERQRRKLEELHASILNLIKAKGKCEKCGFSDLRALEIHHHFGSYHENYFKDLKEIIEGKVPYSILCANCHKILHNPRKV